MSQIITNWMESRLSRRGFLAWTGKVTLAVGMAMTGANMLALRVWAACCAGTPCTGCQNPPAICPIGYVPGLHHYCCDTTGAAPSCHQCTPCHSDSQIPPDCVCEYDLGFSCNQPPCV
jgi:hypothetical protein